MSVATRRDFLATSAVAAGATWLAGVPAVHAGGSDELKVGLIGCGGRGTGAAEQACSAGSGIVLTAMGDVFADHLAHSKKHLEGALGNRFAVKDDHCFVGFDAYQHVINSGVDVVVLTTPPHFRPLHLKAAVAAGKHVFAEKPVAVDGPGVRAVLAACAEAKQKNLAVVAGFCWRYHDGVRQVMSHLHDGAVGDYTALQCTYNCSFNTDLAKVKRRDPGWSDMEYQLRNWNCYTWLSGDHNVEQHVHSLDKMAWAMKDQYPVKASGMGGRAQRTDAAFGNVFDHHAVVYEFAGGLKLFAYCRQQAGAQSDVTDHVIGTKGIAHISGSDGSSSITGSNPWKFTPSQSRKVDMYQSEHNELFASIRSGKPLNDGERMARSSLMAIMGRMATYTGQVITWDMAMKSEENLTPEKYEFGPMPTPIVAIPGVTRFA